VVAAVLLCVVTLGGQQRAVPVNSANVEYTPSPCSVDSLIQNVKIDTASAGNVQLVAISGSTVVTVCSYKVVASGATAFQLIYGTGTACATGETDHEGPMLLTTNSGVRDSGDGNKLFAGSAGAALCLENSNAIQVSGNVRFVQQ
jgi:hypothetical protein